MEKTDTVTAEQKPAHLSVDEIREILDCLSNADLARLTKQARLLADGSGMAADDLFQEAIRRSLDGKRNCPRDVLFRVYLYGVMKSIAHEERKQWNRDKPLGGELNETNPILRKADERPNPEKAASERQEVDLIITRIEELFADDAQGLTIIMGDIDGCTPAEICAIEPMTVKEYAAARKRVRRKLQRKYPEGFYND